MTAVTLAGGLGESIIKENKVWAKANGKNRWLTNSLVCVQKCYYHNLNRLTIRCFYKSLEKIP